MLLPNYPGLAASEAEALQRFLATRRCDPFPEIPPSLLNSADIHDYVRMTGMLQPFYPHKLKSASYASVDTSKPAIRGRRKTGHRSGNSSRGVVARLLRREQVAFSGDTPVAPTSEIVAL